MNDLENELLEMKNRMDAGKYSFTREYNYQVVQMFAFAAGYSPDMSVGDIYKIISKIQKGEIV